MDRHGLLQYTLSQLKCKPMQTSNLKNLLVFLGNDEFEYLAVLDLLPNLARLSFTCFLIGKRILNGTKCTSSVNTSNSNLL